jgi:hypothetical protein
LWGNSIRYCEYWKISPEFLRALAGVFASIEDYLLARDVLNDLINGGLRYEWTYGDREYR